MDVNEEEVLISLRGMGGDSDDELHENGVVENGHAIVRQHASYQPSVRVSLQWFDLRVFYVRVSKCMLDDDSTPEYLTLNHVPLNRDTLLEVNGMRTSIYSDGVSTLLKRDRLDKQSEEVTFVCTDSIRMTGSVKFEVFRENLLVLSGRLELCHSNGSVGEHSRHHHGQIWSMSCESDLVGGAGFLKGNQNLSPTIEVYVAGSFSGSPIILTQTLQLSHRRRQMRKGMLEAIPEYEASTTLTMPSRNYPEFRQDDEGHNSAHWGMEYIEGEDGVLSWFNAGVRVGVGIGLGICVGVGIGVGLLVRTYHGTTRNFTRRLL